MPFSSRKSGLHACHSIHNVLIGCIYLFIPIKILYSDPGTDLYRNFFYIFSFSFSLCFASQCFAFWPLGWWHFKY